MPYKVAWHSTEPNCEVYHNHDACTEGNNIEKRYFAWGIGNKRICKHCEKLADQDAMVEKLLVERRTQSLHSSLFGGKSSYTGLLSGMSSNFKSKE